MSAMPEATGVAAGTELLERAISYTRRSLVLVTPQRLSRPTPCTEWDLAQLLAHLDDSLTALLEAAVERRVLLAPARPQGLDASVARVNALRLRSGQLLGVWSRLQAEEEVAIGGRSLPARLVAETGALEIAVHGWDVAWACGQDLPLPEALARDLLAAAPRLVSEADRAGRFAPAVPCAPTAPASTAILAFTGRTPGRSP
jgi:uncharacterized protein (TIGR03086 family)